MDRPKIVLLVNGNVPNMLDPEEHVRQAFARELVERYGYRLEDMRAELPVKMGRATKYADIALFRDRAPHEQHDAYMIIECKRADVSNLGFEEAVKQLKSYMAACHNCHFGMVVAGARRVCFRDQKGLDGRYDSVPVPDIPPLPRPARGSRSSGTQTTQAQTEDRLGRHQAVGTRPIGLRARPPGRTSSRTTRTSPSRRVTSSDHAAWVRWHPNRAGLAFWSRVAS
jgi:type I restriction enzyme M protein